MPGFTGRIRGGGAEGPAAPDLSGSRSGRVRAVQRSGRAHEWGRMAGAGCP